MLMAVCSWAAVSMAQSFDLQPYQKALDEHVMRHKIVVGFIPGFTLSQKQQLLERAGLELAWEVTEMNLAYVRLHNVPRTYKDLKAVLETLERIPEVTFASPILNSSGGTGYTTTNVLYAYPNNAGSAEWQALVNDLTKNEGNSLADASFLPGAVKITLNKTYPLNALELALVLHNGNLVAFAEPNYVLNPIVASADPMYNRQWAHVNDSSTVFLNGINAIDDADMDVDSAWTITRGDSSIKIAVIDSGVDTLHEDLRANLLPGYDATGGGSGGYPNTDKRSNAHGTACSGIIAAIADNNLGIAGVASNCKVVPIKVFYYIDTTVAGIPLTDIPYSTSDRFADAITWAWQTADVDVMSNSWGVDNLTLPLLPGNPALVDSAIVRAQQLGRGGLGVAQFFSSGNEDTRPIWPSRIPQTIAVNATSMCDERKFNGSCDGESWTGCWGAGIDISAPGVKIVTCDITGIYGYTTTATGHYTFSFNGTSAACPHAAAVAALMLSIRSDLTEDALRWLMGNTADKVGGYNYNKPAYAGTWSFELGYGRINAYKALQAAQTYTSHSNLSGIADTEVDDLQLQVFPNPLSGGQLQVRFNQTASSEAFISIYSLNGQRVVQLPLGNIAAGVHTQPVDVDLQAGVYMVQVTSASGTSCQKIVVSR